MNGARLNTHAKMTTVSNSMGSVVKSLGSTLNACNLQNERDYGSLADDYGLKVSVGLPQVMRNTVALKRNEKVDEDDLGRRSLAELKARG
ncbi:hypothetical protein CTI12_AA164550 [Artemisia annua]|uniref:Uncharacterized protein n=1 Tax=Artemisia annua TaxID=35608 RepID=A0A2U1PDJ0_ARTAN|nr:hypothetical protein CTI12_AA164550 [Artemisia annua]